jgi:hypothetical protein
LKFLTSLKNLRGFGLGSSTSVLFWADDFGLIGIFVELNFLLFDPVLPLVEAPFDR